MLENVQERMSGGQALCRWQFEAHGPTMQLFMWVFGNLNSGSHAWVAGTLPTEQFSQWEFGVCWAVREWEALEADFHTIPKRGIGMKARETSVNRPETGRK